MSARAFGLMPDGRAVDAHTLSTPGGPEVTVLTLGATVQRLRIPDSDGHLHDIALGFDDVQGYLAPSNPYLGATVGRYANRIADARFSLEGTTHVLAANENRTCRHGGAQGFHQRLWQVRAVGDDFLSMELVSPDGDQGFPGELTALATYRVLGNSVVIELTATCDAPTVINLTNHTYFNLAGPDGGTVDDHLLMVAADAYLPVDHRSIPLGRLDPVAGTPFDLTTPAVIGLRARHAHPQVVQASGIDHAYIPRGSGLRTVARLEHPGSSRFLEISTDQPTLQVYTGNFLNGTLVGHHGRLLRQGDGIALETQRYPDAPNQPGFPSALLRPTETYRAVTRWTLGSGFPATAGQPAPTNSPAASSAAGSASRKSRRGQ